MLALSPELRVMLSPQAAYRRLLAAPPAAGAWVLVRRPLLLALLVGALVSLTTTGALTLRLWPSAALCWSVAPALQMLAAAPLVYFGRRRPLPLSSGLDLLFVAHGPWSLWLVAIGAAGTALLPLGSNALPSTAAVLWTGVVPLAWTSAIVYGFCRVVLGLERRRAAVAMVAHQLAVWTSAAVYAGVVVSRLARGRS